MALLIIVFLLCGFVGAVVALKIPHTIIGALTLIVSFVIPWLLLRPMGTDLILSFVAWALGAIVAYFVVRRTGVF